MLKYRLLTCFIAGLSVAVSAQDLPVQEDLICLSYYKPWLGTLTDFQNIKTVPIPESYRFEFESSECRHSSPMDLIKWHRHFGSEDTMRAALKYVQDGIIAQQVNPAPKQQVEDYARIAGYYASGADAFDSLEFIQLAEKYHEKAKALYDELSPDVFVTGWIGAYRSNGHSTALEKLSREIAVTRALITDETSDIDNAASLLSSANMPFMDEFSENAFERTDALCDIKYSELPQGIQDVCDKSHGEYDQDVREFLTLQTLLATVEASLSGKTSSYKSYTLFHDVDRMLRIADADQSKDYTNLRQPEFSQARARLNLALSDMHFRRALKLLETNIGDKRMGDMDFKIAAQLRISLDQLLAAERYTPRYSSPSQWEKIAIKFVDRMELWSDVEGRILAANGASSSGRHIRELEYFKTGLEP